MMLTEIRNKTQEELFSEDMISQELKIPGAHNDGITVIELIQEN